MAKKAKFSVRGYFKDLMGWFGLMKARQAWIDAASTDIDMSDHAADLSREMHPGLVKAKIVEIKDETPSSRSFTMSACDGYKLPFFYAGQHMSVKFCIDGKWTTRPFSISSAPMEADRNNRIQITLRRKNGGYVSSWVWDNWKSETKCCLTAASAKAITAQSAMQNTLSALRAAPELRRSDQ